MELLGVRFVQNYITRKEFDVATTVFYNKGRRAVGPTELDARTTWLKYTRIPNVPQASLMG